MNSEVEFKKLLVEEKFFLWVYIFSFAFDFKGEVGGSLSQFIMAGFSIAAGIGFIIFRNRKIKNLFKLTPGIKKIAVLWCFYLLSTIFTALIAGVMFERYIRVFFPLLLCGISLLIICKFQRRLIDPHEIIKPLIIASVVSVLWKAYYSIQITGIEIHSMRYQLLSGGGILFIIAYALANIVNRKRLNLFLILGICIAGITSLLSITRSLILTVFFLFCGYIWMGFKTPLHINIKRNLLLVIVVILAFIPAWYIAEQLRPGIFQIWAGRLFFYRYVGNSFISDITLLTRLSEWGGQWKSLTENVVSLFFGRGLGSEYFWDPQYLYDIRQFIGFTNIQEKIGWYSGHSMWTYSLYSGGFLFGWVIIAVSFLSLFRIMAVIRKTSLGVAPFLQDMAPLLFFVILGFISQGFTSSPLAFRFFSLIIGLVFGLIHWFYDYVKLEEAQQIG
jgi:hypothetical protein